MIGGLASRHTVDIIRGTEVDDGRGGTIIDMSSATRTPSEGWAVDAGDTTENVDGRDSTTVHYTIRGPLTADVRPADQIDLFGIDHEIVGGVLRQPGPTPRTSHTILRLRSVTG